MWNNMKFIDYMYERENIYIELHDSCYDANTGEKVGLLKYVYEEGYDKDIISFILRSTISHYLLDIEVECPVELIEFIDDMNIRRPAYRLFGYSPCKLNTDTERLKYFRPLDLNFNNINYDDSKNILESDSWTSKYPGFDEYLVECALLCALNPSANIFIAITWYDEIYESTKFEDGIEFGIQIKDNKVTFYSSEKSIELYRTYLENYSS